MILFVGFVAEGRDTTDLSVMITDDSNDLNDNTTVGGHVMHNFAKALAYNKVIAILLGIDTYGCPTISKIYNDLFLGSYTLSVNLDVIINFHLIFTLRKP